MLLALLAIGLFPLLHAHADWPTPEKGEHAGNLGEGLSVALNSVDDPHISFIDMANDSLAYDRRVGAIWSTEIIDSVGGARAKTSIDLDSSGKAHISYYDSSGLKYARWTGTSWVIRAVDPVGSAGVGVVTSIAVDSSDIPHISYYDSGNGDLKYAIWTGSSWSTHTVDAAGQMGSFSSIHLDSSQNPHISYSSQDASKDLKYAQWTGTSWSTQTVSVDGGQGGGAADNSLVLDSSDNTIIGYQRSDNGHICYAEWSGSSWLFRTVDTQGASPGNGLSIALDSSDNLQLAFALIETRKEIFYAKWVGFQWVVQAIEATGGFDVTRPEMALDSTGLAFFGYYDVGGQILRHAKLAPDSPLSGVPSTPIDHGVFSATTSVAFSWTKGTVVDPTSAIGRFYLQIGTDPVTNDASMFNDDVGSVWDWTVQGALEGATYYARVRARNDQWLFTVWSDWSDGIVVDISTPGAPASLASGSHPIQSAEFPVVNPDFTLSGPSDFSGIAGYHWRIDANAGTIPTAADALNSSPIRTNSLLADGTWYFHVVARDGAGNVGADAIHYKFIVEAAVNPAADNTLETADGVKVDIPAGALSGATSINIQSPSSTPAPNGPGLSATSVVKDFQMVDGTSQFSRGITITLPYTAGDVAGMDESGLRMFYYDTARGYWVLVPNSSVDTVSNEVYGTVDHFTLFGVMGFTPANGEFDRLGNYPNPFSPLRGQRTRISYALDQDRDVRIRIYDAFGRLVSDDTFGAGSNGGRTGPNEVQWDGRAGDGRYVEMGGYICVVDSGDKREVIKIGVK
ncbi:hypothetical protein ACFL2T_04455 [Elusimicrobiota bacterium]